MIQIDLEGNFTPVFNFIFLNKPADGIKKALKSKSPVDWEIFSKKTYRVAVLADVLYKIGRSNIPHSEAEEQIIAVLCESFIFHLRVLYDLLTSVLSGTNNNRLPQSYHRLIQKLKSDPRKIKGIPQNVCNNIVRLSKPFEELKGLRDAIKSNVLLNIFFKEGVYYIRSMKFMQTDANSKQLVKYENELSRMIVDFSISFYITLLVITNKVEMEN